MIGTALSGLVDSLSGMGWKLILVFFGIIAVISGPAMIMAWLKLRRRNIAPLLNANGWAINADAIISVIFGNTLTEQAQFPMMKLVDPYAPVKKISTGGKWAIALSVIVAVVAIAIFVLWMLDIRIIATLF